jgi:hypothetical protein
MNPKWVGDIPLSWFARLDASRIEPCLSESESPHQRAVAGSAAWDGAP